MSGSCGLPCVQHPPRQCGRAPVGLLQRLLHGSRGGREVAEGRKVRHVRHDRPDRVDTPPAKSPRVRPRQPVARTDQVPAEACILSGALLFEDTFSKPASAECCTFPEVHQGRRDTCQIRCRTNMGDCV